MKKFEPCGKEKSPLLHQLAFSYRRRTWRRPEAEKSVWRQLQKRRWRRRTQEENKMTGYNFHSVRLRDLFDAVPQSFAVFRGLDDFRGPVGIFNLKRDPAATFLNKLKMYFAIIPLLNSRNEPLRARPLWYSFTRERKNKRELITRCIFRMFIN